MKDSTSLPTSEVIASGMLNDEISYFVRLITPPLDENGQPFDSDEQRLMKRTFVKVGIPSDASEELLRLAALLQSGPTQDHQQAS